ncbi:APC membrane recruitment protein 2 [Pangasianodon hypophthalmus]|uniref:APC membrane recruitment protein 2 n=1 Tax=Pangasianodon hypophthalmus TaxID=310915 RepID=UPI000F00040A|nr:APC membrane recruitment protein 2 [Pangasianodon hypophthalmus]
MDAQPDSCEPPPCDSQPPGKIRKALKLFSKRKPGSGVASIFSVRVKGEGGLKSPPSRSKTLDGLTETMAPEAEAESVDLDQEDSHKEDVALDDSTSMKNNLESTSTRQSISSLTSAKSLSFLSMLRRNRKGGGGEREAQTESHRSGQQRKGLKSLFGSVRWHRKDKEEEDDVLPGPPLLASRSNSVEIMKENLTLTPRPARHCTDESEFEPQPPPSQDDHEPEDTNKVSGAAKPSTNERLSTLLGDISSILSLDSLAGGGDIVADVEAEWVKVSSRVEVEAGTGEALKKEKALLAPKPTLSAAPTLSSTSSTIPSPTTKLISSSTLPKPMPSPTTKQTFSPPSTPSPTTSTKPIPSHVSPPTFSLTTKPVPSPVLSPDSSPILSPNIVSVPITIPKSPPTTPTLTIPTKPTLTFTSPLTPESSPKPSPTLFPAPSPATISKTLISLAEKAAEPAAAFAIITEPTHSPTTKPTPTACPTPITRPIHSIAQDTKHSSAPVTKYPPFITSTKPLPTAPVIRPKIVTTFGLSTSRNTLPIIKPEPKQSAHQIKSGPFQSQTEKNGSGSVVPKVSPAEPGPPHVAKHFAASNQATPATSSATSENPPHKPELVHTSLPSGSSLLPTLSTRPAPNIAPCYVPRGEKGLEDVAIPRVVEDPQPASSYKPEKKILVMKPTTLSKIPVSGGGKSKQHHKDAQSNGEERQWSLPTPVHEEETLISLSPESSSKDALSDLSTESGAITPVLPYSNEDILDSAARPTIGTVSMPRESKIPIKPGSTATYHSLQGKTEVARSKIPVSKVPIRRTSNKTGPTSTAAATRK